MASRRDPIMAADDATRAMAKNLSAEAVFSGLPLAKVTLEEDRLARMTIIQRDIFRFIQENPGAMIGAVAEGVGCSHNNASRHLRTLSEDGMLVRERDGRTCRHYLTSSPRFTRILACLDDPKKRYVIECMVDQPNRFWVINELANQTSVYHTFLTRLLKGLEKHDCVVLETREGLRSYAKATERLVDLVRRHLGPAQKEP